MAIQIKAGMLPKYGRITMPKGTFLSNPSTAADGQLGGANGMNPSGSSYNPFSPVVDAFKSVFSALSKIPGEIKTANDSFAVQQNQVASQVNNWFKNTPAGKAIQNSPAAQNYVNTMGGLINPASTPTNTFSPSSPSNSLVGNQIQPGQILFSSVVSMFKGMTLDQINQVMASRGYTNTFVAGTGVIYTPDPNLENQAASNPNGIYGQNQQGTRPDWVDPTTLAPGEGVLLKGGTYLQGGTPTSSGQSQYAITYNNPNALHDKHGKYHMVDYIAQDQNGNWKHVYRQELRKVYRRNSQKRRYAAREKAQAQAQQNLPSNATNQLVTLRANYG